MKQYYHSSGLYNSLIYKKISNKNNVSKEKTLANLFDQMKNNLIKYMDNKNYFLPSNQNINSKIMVIGDMPSQTDNENKYIFSDESGELLNKMLKAISINMDDIYLTNALPFYTKESKNIFAINKSYLKKALINHISIINPQIILLLGSTPLEILFNNKFSISNNRGQWINININNNNIYTLCTFHPNFLIQQPNQKKNAWIDLQSFQKKLKI